MSALPSTGRADQAVLGADATRALYERHGRRIFAFCFSRLGTREEAEDATQTTFLNAFRSLQGGVVPAFELAWLFRIADNVCRDRKKAAWRRNRLEATRDLEELQDVVAAPEQGSDGLSGLGEALASMPERQRRAILLREWQGLSYGEIAQELGVTRAAVETLIFRARRSLARGLEEPRQARRAGFDVGSLLALAKTIFQGGTAVKVAAAVAGAGLLVAAPLRDAERARPEQRPSQPAVATTPTASEHASQAPSTRARRPSRRPPVVGVEGPAARASARPATHAVPSSPGTPSRPSDKASPPATAPASGPDVRPESPAPITPPAAPQPPSAGPLPPPPPVPSVPEAPSLPAVPAVDPPPLPEVPDLPLDVPDLPAVPSLP
jgi:RNA polymerase sigma-70 factor (ECF subfamily)